MTRAPIWANPDSIGCVFICFDFWFLPEPGRAEGEPQFHRLDSNSTIWFVALAREQLTASPCGRPSDNRFHWWLPFLNAECGSLNEERRRVPVRQLSVLHSAFCILRLNYRRHRIRYPGGLLSSCQGIGGRFCFGSVGRICRLFLLAVVIRRGAGRCNWLRSHCGMY